MVRVYLFSKYPLFPLLLKPRFLLFLILPVRWFAFLMHRSTRLHDPEPEALAEQGESHGR